MKIVKRGWLPKRTNVSDVFSTHDTIVIDTLIFTAKGKQTEWNPDDWPPRRVTITVELEE